MYLKDTGIREGKEMLFSQDMLSHRMTSVVREMFRDILKGPTYHDLNK